MKKVNELKSKVQVIRDKISARLVSVDEVIEQIEYIKSLAKDDHVLEDLET